MAICLDFDWQTNEFMLYCRTTQLREKTMLSYEQTLRLFEKWCQEEQGITTVDKVNENVVRRYIFDLQERGKYTFYANDKQKAINCLVKEKYIRQKKTDKAPPEEQGKRLNVSKYFASQREAMEKRFPQPCCKNTTKKVLHRMILSNHFEAAPFVYLHFPCVRFQAAGIQGYFFSFSRPYSSSFRS